MKKIFAFTSIIFICCFYAYGAENPLIPYFDGKKWGFCDNKMNLVVEAQYDSCGDMIEGMAWVKKIDRYGYININGKETIAPAYSEIKNFQDGFAIVSKKEKSGIINSKGEFFIPLTDNYISSFNGTLAVISKDYTYGLMDNNKTIIAPVKFKKLDVMNKNFFIAAESSKTDKLMLGKHFLLTNKGETSAKSYDLIYPLNSGYAKIKNDTKWGYIDASGKEIAPAVYDDIRNIKPDGSSCFLKNGKWGILNGNGIIIKEPVYDNVSGGNSYYDELQQFNQKYFAVCNNSIWGTLSLNGQVLIKQDYTMLGYGNSEYMPAFKSLKKDGKSSETGLTIINGKGIELFKPIPAFNKTGVVSEELLAVGNPAGKWGYINLKGDTVIRPAYDEAREFNNGFAVVRRNTRFGLINRKNDVIENFNYSELKVSDIYPGLYAAEISGKRVYLKPGSNHYWR